MTVWHNDIARLLYSCVSHCLIDVAIVKPKGEPPGNTPVLVQEVPESDNTNNPIEGRLVMVLVVVFITVHFAQQNMTIIDVYVFASWE